jgi:hypothetical protein
MMGKTYSGRCKPDRYFMKQLKELDNRLGCRFREDLDRFVITYEKIYGPPDEIMVVSKPHFRQPDKRELMFLCEGDLHRTDMRERLEISAAYFAKSKEDEQKMQADEIRNMTKDDKIQLANVYRETFNTGGKPSAIRRITPPVKGKTIEELRTA